MRNITIQEAMKNIDMREYLLPAIQREFVWNTYQIERLFDSLMRDYPIGTFLFWRVEGEEIGEFQFYEFFRYYHQKDKRHNEKVDVKGKPSVTAILDGQQRLTALYLGLHGWHATKLKHKRWDDHNAYPPKKLYLNLLAPPSPDSECEYDFKFLTDKESEERNDKVFWFPVGKVLDFHKSNDSYKYLQENQLTEISTEQADFASETLTKLREVIHKDTLINYFLEENELLDKVLDIFIRINSGGTKLSYSDLLLSIATAQWEEKDAREVITKFVDDLNNIGNGFAFNKDFVLKACLVLSDFPSIKFKVHNFNKKNMRQIESDWDSISKAIEEAVGLVSNFGFNRDTLPSMNAVIPIAYYLLKAHPDGFVESLSHKEERNKIFNWLIRVLLKQTFGGQSDRILSRIRSIIGDNYKTGFPLHQIARSLRVEPTKSIIFAPNEIEDLPNRPNNRYAFPSLAVVYPTLDFRNKFHKDHIFPRKLFSREKLLAQGIPEDKVQFCLENYNTLANLQLLPGTENQEKSAKLPKVWMDATMNEQEQESYKKMHFIPRDILLSLDNFKEFIEKRRELLVEEFSIYLKMSDDGVAYK